MTLRASHSPTFPHRQSQLLAFVMAGGEGSRMQPLTASRCKPAVPFGCHHRVVDFVLSNLVNSGVGAIHVLVQYRAASLIDHIDAAWRRPGQDLTPITTWTPRDAGFPYRGTADAVAQHLGLIEASGARWVAVFGADHVYRMDLQQMLAEHVAGGAGASVAAVPVALREASNFGVLDVDSHGRITRFTEKPASPRPIASRPDHALVSTGNYLFDAEVLIESLRKARIRDETDFGAQVLPRLVKSHRLAVHDFSPHPVPGADPDRPRGYWRDVGTLDAYFDSHFDLLGDLQQPDLGNASWPIRGAAAERDAVAANEDSEVVSSAVGPGCRIRQAQLDHAVLRAGVSVDADARVAHAIVMDDCRIGRGARLHRAIVDADNDVPAGESIGFDRDADAHRFHVTPGGVTVVPRGHFGPPPAAKPSGQHRAGRATSSA